MIWLGVPVAHPLCIIRPNRYLSKATAEGGLTHNSDGIKSGVPFMSPDISEELIYNIHLPEVWKVIKLTNFLQAMSSHLHLTTWMDFGSSSCIIFCSEQISKIQFRQVGRRDGIIFTSFDTYSPQIIPGVNQQCGVESFSDGQSCFHLHIKIEKFIFVGSVGSHQTWFSGAGHSSAMEFGYRAVSGKKCIKSETHAKKNGSVVNVMMRSCSRACRIPPMGPAGIARRRRQWAGASGEFQCFLKWGSSVPAEGLSESWGTISIEDCRRCFFACTSAQTASSAGRLPCNKAMMAASYINIRHVVCTHLHWFRALVMGRGLLKKTHDGAFQFYMEPHYIFVALLEISLKGEDSDVFTAGKTSMECTRLQNLQHTRLTERLFMAWFRGCDICMGSTGFPFESSRAAGVTPGPFLVFLWPGSSR
ncbi:hypothetical protein VP01_1124g1 [Puccinia sorghi]|uniref:Uncharacterized protein n=1 Tax=Puccinia sorghi TaxID=27349 RepID=A0A0L6VS93_9BASI|nr:hypothetical protein VP01_1124g1 [Puccinia sorghi]